MRSQVDVIHFATFIQMAKESGVILEIRPVNFGATCAKAPSVTKYFFRPSVQSECRLLSTHPVWDSQPTAARHDKMLLGVINMVMVSGLMPNTLYGIYDRRKVYAVLCNIVCGIYDKVSVSP